MAPDQNPASVAIGRHGVGRRTLVAGAAWAVPTIAVATPVHAAATSGVYSCVESNIPNRWSSEIRDISGTFSGDTGPGNWLDPEAGTDGRYLFLQMRDNASTTRNAEGYIETTFDIGACTKLDLSYRLKWGMGIPNNSSVGQAVTISTALGGGGALVPQQKYHTRNIPTGGNGLFSGSTQLSGSYGTGTWYEMPTYSVSNPSTSPSTVTLRYTFSIPARGSRAASDDIFITSPIGVCSLIDGCVPA